ncbi:hypothetical protein B0H14DRAFT_2653877 [Mycena olivaceomarginata]|nr:hypothetical protein B0H14DRAFT_2653877 [Mycena olivaceomarginata]
MIEIGRPPSSAQAPHSSPRSHTAAMLPCCAYSPSPTPASTLPRVAGPEECARIVAAICARGGDMMIHRVLQQVPQGKVGRTCMPLDWIARHAVRLREPRGEHQRRDRRRAPGAGRRYLARVAKGQWGSYCTQHILEHGSEKHRRMALEHLLNGLLEFATNEQGSKSVAKALNRVVQRMCKGSSWISRSHQLTASILPTRMSPAQADKDQRAALYDCIRGHIISLRGCRNSSMVIWLFDWMRAYYGY